MYDDILGKDKSGCPKEFDLFTKEMYPSSCAVYCLIQMNDLFDKEILEMSDGGEKPILITEKGEKNCMYYFNEVLGREPNDEDIKVGMDVVRNEGYI